MHCPNCKTDFAFNQDKPIVVLGVPAMDAVIHYSVLAQWDYLLHHYRAVFVIKDNTYIDMARNQIVSQGASIAKAAYGKDPDYYLFVDADSVIGKRHPSGNGDVTMRPDFIDRLIWRNVPIISGSYVKKRDPVAQLPVFGRGNPSEPFMYTIEEGRMIEVDWVGGGYLLVKGEVFAKIDSPWFQNRNEPIDNGPNYRLVGEDVYFCRKAKEAGFPIYVDLDVKIGHHGSIAWPADD